jgi:hypothetical protein
MTLMQRLNPASLDSRDIAHSRLWFVQRAPHFLPLLFDLLDPVSHRVYKSLSRIRLSESKKGVIFHLFENAAVRVKPTGDECFHFCVGLNFGSFLVQPGFALLKEAPKIREWCHGRPSRVLPSAPSLSVTRWGEALQRIFTGIRNEVLECFTGPMTVASNF